MKSELLRSVEIVMWMVASKVRCACERVTMRMTKLVWRNGTRTMMKKKGIARLQNEVRSEMLELSQ